MRKAFKYRLWTNRNHERELDTMLETHRRLYNACLEQRKNAFESEKKSIKYTEQSVWFKEERKANNYFARINFSSAQATMRRLDKAYQNFFRRAKSGEKPGYPRFKSRDHFDSIEFPSHGDGIRLKENRLRVQHVGIIRVKLHRPTEGTIKTLSLKKEAGKWHLVVSCDLGEIPAPVNDLPPVGIDVGIESFLTTSDDKHVPNPNLLKKELPELRRAQRSVSRKKKGGKNRKKAVKRVQKLHAKVRNVRNEFHHKVVNDLLRCYGTIAVESLRVSNMLRNHRLARAISDVAWATFVSILLYKAESAGAVVMGVDPRYTSQECCGCGRIVEKSLSVRVHDCPFCGLRLHRDTNAARNILKRALQARTGPTGLNPEVAQGVQRSRLL
jgi:putative transposase